MATAPIPRRMACSWCDHEEHILRCGVDLGIGVACPCNRVPVPGIYHPEETS